MQRSTTSYRKDVEAFLDSRGLKPRFAGEADDSLVLLEAAMREGLVAVVPRSIARDAIVAGQVRVLEHVDVASDVHALYPDNTPAALTRNVVAAIAARAKADVESLE
jgi:DNA-binding transcriptional LysR family regulator